MERPVDDHLPARSSAFRERPTSHRGIWAGRLLLVGVGLWVLVSVLTGLFGRRDAGTVDDVMRVTGPILGVAFVATGISAFIVSLLAFARDHERSWVVWLGIAFGALALVFLVGELVLPH